MLQSHFLNPVRCERLNTGLFPILKYGKYGQILSFVLAKGLIRVRAVSD